MDKIRIGIICPSEIAFRRFMPAVIKNSELEYVGVAYAKPEERFKNGTEKSGEVNNSAKKAEKFRENYGGRVFEGYRNIILSDDIDAIYLPLPPALHYGWAKLALENGKNVFLEKPSTTSADDTKKLIALADRKGLALHENYMFVYHKQLEEIRKLTAEIGDLRLYRIAFGFPKRGENDFRYNRALGGGALTDCGGYTLKLADLLLGEKSRVVYAQLNNKKGYEVDLYGSVVMVNEMGVTAQASFGMDNSYKCELEIWGSKGFIRTGRIFTAPVGFVPTAEITTSEGTDTVQLPGDDAFFESIKRFCQCVRDEKLRKKNYRLLARQAELVDDVKRLASGT